DKPNENPPPSDNQDTSTLNSLTPEQKQEHFRNLKEEAEKEAQKRGTSLNKLKQSDIPETYLDFSEHEQQFNLLQEYLNQRIKVAQLNQKIRPSLEILIKAQTYIAWQAQLAKYRKMFHTPLELK
ncbi:5043_t:CDS:2, partial [Ambispora gerdemannii]